MRGEEIIKYISESQKKTPVKVYIQWKRDYEEVKGNSHGIDSIRSRLISQSRVFSKDTEIIFGDWENIGPLLAEAAAYIENIEVENNCRNSGIPLLDLKEIPARIEPGAIIREKVSIGNNAVIMMGAIINIGASVGSESMVDMGAVLGGRAIVGDRCHIGAGAVLAGVIEPFSAKPVIIEDDVIIGANAVIIEGVHIGKGAVVAAGSTVIDDVPRGVVVAGVPARVVKLKDEGTKGKTDIIGALRNI